MESVRERGERALAVHLRPTIRRTRQFYYTNLFRSRASRCSRRQHQVLTVAIDPDDLVERGSSRRGSVRQAVSLITITELDRSRRGWICVRSALDTTRARFA